MFSTGLSCRWIEVHEQLLLVHYPRFLYVTSTPNRDIGTTVMMNINLGD